MTPPTRHTVSSEGVIFFFIYKLINFKLFIHIMLNISLVIYSVVADYKIYTSFIYGNVQHLQYLHCLQKKQKYIYKIDQKVFRWASNYVLTLEVDVDCPVLCFLLLYLHR